MATDQIWTDDEGFASAQATLNEQVDNMVAAGNTARQIQEEIAQHYIADSSTTFQTHVDNWIGAYNKIMQAFDGLLSSMNSASHIMGDAESTAQAHGNSWVISNGMYTGLAS